MMVESVGPERPPLALRIVGMVRALGFIWLVIAPVGLKAAAFLVIFFCSLIVFDFFYHADGKCPECAGGLIGDHKL